MGYVETNSSVPGTPISLIVRDKPLPAQIVQLPLPVSFPLCPNRFKR
jgi:hypothetical protein